MVLKSKDIFCLKLIRTLDVINLDFVALSNETGSYMIKQSFRIRLVSKQSDCTRRGFPVQFISLHRRSQQLHSKCHSFWTSSRIIFFFFAQNDIKPQSIKAITTVFLPLPSVVLLWSLNISMTFSTLADKLAIAKRK